MDSLLRAKTLVLLGTLLSVVNLSACATQYQHRIKKSSEFYGDLDWCERKADSEGYPHVGATRDSIIENCLLNFGWKIRKNVCLSRHLDGRTPATEFCE